MTEVAPSELKHAVESQHGGTATLVQSVPVDERRDSKPVWQGVVHVFDLADNPNPRDIPRFPARALRTAGARDQGRLRQEYLRFRGHFGGHSKT